MESEGSLTLEARGQDRIADAYAVYAPGALRAAYFLVGDRDVAHDLVQDAFVRIMGRFGSAREPEKFQAYLNRTLVNLSRNYFRRGGLERRFLQRSVLEEKVTDPVRDDELWQALRGLPHRQRTALVLRYYMDLSEQQAADAMACSERALNSLVTRGLSSLRAHLGNVVEES